ncbi:MAG: DUF1576 domain-containing protein, partial [Clostridia bacterium]|nr:DUF1576 domain-containing protein [Clostridia bacterium]
MERSKRDHILFLAVISLFPLVFILVSLLLSGREELLTGLSAIWCNINAFVTDATAVGGLASALLNAGLMGIFAVVILMLARVPVSGRALGPLFLSMGAGMFGASVLTAIPIALGGFLYAFIRREAPPRPVRLALQCCTLSPALAALYFSAPGRCFGCGILLGVLAGLAIGFCALPLALHTLSLHQGFNLYSMGIPLGVLGLLFFAVHRELVLVPENLAKEYTSPMLIGQPSPLFFYLLFAGFFALLLALGLLFHRPQSPPYTALLGHHGLEADFALHYGMPNVLLNMGLMGFLLLVYFLLVNAPFNGVAAGSLLCSLCWTGSGAHPRNTFPILFGYCFTALLLSTPLNSPELVIGACFATGLAPISGRYGGLYGILAGTLHAFLMPAVLGLNGGFNMQTAAFVSGVVALFLYPLLHEISRRKNERQEQAARSGVAGELL